MIRRTLLEKILSPPEESNPRSNIPLTHFTNVSSLLECFAVLSIELNDLRFNHILHLNFSLNLTVTKSVDSPFYLFSFSFLCL
jgi:hypothetical protein